MVIDAHYLILVEMFVDAVTLRYFVYWQQQKRTRLDLVLPPLLVPQQFYVQDDGSIDYDIEYYFYHEHLLNMLPNCYDHIFGQLFLITHPPLLSIEYM
jgi:hypothetical protein